MPITIGNNIASLRAQRKLAEGTSALSKTFERLASGSRINRASEDAAGSSVASSLEVGARIYTQSVRNLNDGLSALNIADGALEGLSTVITRIRELATQAANDTFGTKQRQAINQEAQALRNEYNRIIATTKFNGRALLDGTFSNVTLQLGDNAGLRVDMGTELLRGVGDGTFQNAQIYGSSTGYQPIATADFNRDGNADVVTSGFALWLGNGNTTFKAPVTYDVFGGASNVNGIQISDVNGDGAQDLIGIAPGASSVISIALANGNGTFKYRTTVTAGNDLYKVSLADFNSDGRIDIAAQAGADSLVQIFIGNSDGTFGYSNAYNSTNHRQIASADFNGDGKLDLAAGNSILIGNGNGSFKAAITYAFDSAASVQGIGRSVVDLNGDSYLDVISTSAQEISVNLGNGDGTFRARSTYAHANLGVTWDLVLQDINDDGNSDLLSSQYNSGSFSVALGNGDGSFRAQTTFTGIGTSTGIALADYNNDDIFDTLLVNWGGANNFLIALGNGTQTTTLPSFNLTSRASALSALDSMALMQDNLAKERSNLGAYQSRVAIAINQVQSLADKYKEAAGRIMNVDMAEEAAQYTRLSILQQVAASVLAQANSSPQLALKLLS